jgi:hypothetical protein
MAAESIGTLIPTKIPGLSDAADIQAALRLYHYGSYTFDTAETDPAELVNPSIAYTINDLQDQIDTLSGGSAIQATSFNAKGDLLSASANDTLSVLSVGTNGKVLSANSATTTGLEWITPEVTASSANTFTNKKLSDSTTSIVDNSDNTKVLKFDITGTTGVTGTITSAFTTTRTLTLPDATDTLVGKDTTDTFTNKTLTSPVVNNSTDNYPTIKSPKENINIVASAATGTINFDFETAGILYYTSNASANHTVNIRYNSSTTLNSKMSNGESVTVAWANTNGTTAYYPNVFQIDGNAVTPKWVDGIAPSSGNVSSTDIYVYNIIKTASATFTVFGSRTKFA